MSARSALAVSPFQRALGLHRANRLAEAEAGYRALLRQSPQHPDALHFLGIVLAQQGRPAEAIHFLRRATRLAPRQGAILANLGNALKDAGEPEEALRAYDQALRLAPDDATTLTNRGQLLAALGSLDEALDSHDRALALAPAMPEALNNRGCTLRDLGRPAEAIVDFATALARRPGYVDALLNRGHALRDLGREQEALHCYEEALTRRPDHAPAHASRAATLLALGHSEAALAAYEAALAQWPGNAVLRHNQARALDDLGRHDEALAAYETALRHGAPPADCHFGRGNALADLARPHEAIAAFSDALAAAPNHADARFNRALCRLRIGDFHDGWADYEARWARPKAPPLRHAHIPRWTGAEPLAGRRLLVHAEQGLGDTLQFCRYLPLLAAQGAEVILEAQAPLRRLLARLPGAAQVIGPGDACSTPHLQLPLLSLPQALGLENPLAVGPYILPEPAIAASWAERLPGQRFRIGLTCSGSAGHVRDAQRSIPLAAFAPLLAQPASFALLQDQCRPADAETLRHQPRLADMRDRLTDLSETAGLIAQLDLVITVDTSIAHLAGAMGKPTWLLLPFIPDWRWGEAGEATAWYPSMRLFRQQRPGDWAPLLAALASALKKELAAAL
ncbi:tetratricopeptide repeat protein [Acetobacteraceae bacterium H6797]|nr:tetratricopeptide repeat protein [Acetobacteraceae bacterium H6797]